MTLRDFLSESLNQIGRTLAGQRPWAPTPEEEEELAYQRFLEQTYADAAARAQAPAPKYHPFLDEAKTQDMALREEALRLHSPELHHGLWHLGG